MSSELHSVIQAVGPEFHGLSYRERLIVRAVLNHLSSPPADDVRDEIEDVLREHRVPWGSEVLITKDILSRFEVRRG